MPKKCQECRESEDGIWINVEWSDKPHDEFLCESCFNHLNVKSGAVSVKGSQWNGEE